MKMNKRRISTIVIGIVLCAALSITVLVSIPALAGRNYPNTNDNGQTYGFIEPENVPDLISAIGIDGTEGYVLEIDLIGEQPNNPEEALEIMKRLEERIEEMHITGERFVRIIPFYAADGVTVIGEFGIGSLPDDEAIRFED
jgi:hypothetical protein